MILAIETFRFMFTAKFMFQHNFDGFVTNLCFNFNTQIVLSSNGLPLSTQYDLKFAVYNVGCLPRQTRGETGRLSGRDLYRLAFMKFWRRDNFSREYPRRLFW